MPRQPIRQQRVRPRQAVVAVVATVAAVAEDAEVPAAAVAGVVVTRTDVAVDAVAKRTTVRS